MSIVEIRIRRFFICEEADVTPAVTIRMDIKDLPGPEEIIARLAENCAVQVTGLPVTDLREMTPVEVERYIADRDDNDQ